MNNSSVNGTSTACPTKGCITCKIWDQLWLPVIIAISSFVFFRFLQYVVRWYMFGKWTFPTFSYFKVRRRRRRRTEDMDSKSLKLVPPNKKWRISNEIVSLIHSVLSGLWALAVLTNHDLLSIDLTSTDSKEARYLVYMSFGYLVHDFLDLIINERSARIIELLFHHGVVLFAFLVTQISCKFLYIVVFGLLMEVNSIFLHARSLCNLYRQPKDSTLFKFIAAINIATFGLFRIAVSLGLIGWQIYMYFGHEVEWYLLLINSLVIYALSITNFILCYRVLAADGLLGKSRGRGDPTARQQEQEQSGAEEGDDDDEGLESAGDADIEGGEGQGRAVEASAADASQPQQKGNGELTQA